MRSLAASQSGFLITGSHSGGVFISSDHGESWESVSVHSGSSITALAINDDGHTLAGVQSPSVEAVVFSSKDAGKSWKGGFGHHAIYNGATMAAIIDGYGWFVSHGGGTLTASFDLGLSWQDIDRSGENFSDIALDSSGALVTTSHYTMRRSTNLGADWSLSLFSNYIGTMTVSDAGTICIVTGDSLLRSTDNGTSWAGAPLSISVNTLTPGFDGNLYASAKAGVFRSTDDGLNWESLGLGQHSVTDVVAESTGHVHAISEDGFFTLEPGQSKWKRRRVPIATIVQCLLADSAGQLYAGTTSGLYSSSDEGTSWDRVEQAVPSILSLGLDRAHRLLVGTLGMQSFQLPLTEESQPANWWFHVAFMSIKVSEDNTYYAGTPDLYGVLQSTNSGISWTVLGPLRQGIFHSIEVDSAGTLYAGNGGVVFALQPDSTTWEIRTDYEHHFGSGRALLISNTGRIVMGAFHGIYLSDNGTQWVRPADSLYLSEVHKIIETRDGAIVAAASNGLFRSVDSGNHWSAWGGSNEEIVAVTADSSGAVYYIPFKPPLPKRGDWASGVEVVSSVPQQFELSVFPNPFNPSTNIRLTIPLQSHVTVSIYDVLGRKRETLVDEKLHPGTFAIRWDGSNYSTGVYFVRAQYGDFAGVKRLMLVK